MTDVLPVVLIGADEDLAVQLIGGHGERRHVWRKLKQRGKSFDIDETQSGGGRLGGSVFVRTGQDEPPRAERGNIHMGGKSFQSRLLQSLRNTTERNACENRRP